MLCPVLAAKVSNVARQPSRPPRRRMQGGTNWQLPSGPAAWAPLLGTPHVMLLGVDVSHAAPGGSTSSMAAVVGSLDAGCSQYGAVILEQTARHEVVLGMVEGAQQLLQAHYDARGLLPQSLLVFRDGVSDSMYASVLQQEVAGIRAACRAVGSPGYSPKVGVGCRRATLCVRAAQPSPYRPCPR